MKALLIVKDKTISNLPIWFKNQKVVELSIEQIIELYNCNVDVLFKHIGDSTIITIIIGKELLF
jgi:hypothetical protein